MARRSTRLSARKSSTPQPQRVVEIVEHAPFTAPRLTSLTEQDEMPGAFPKESPPIAETPSRNRPSEVARYLGEALKGGYKTPEHVTPIRPSAEEMHPKQFQTSTAKPAEEARWLGFFNKGSHTDPPKGASKFAVGAGTPSKTPKTQEAYEFTFRAQSMELSEEARKMMAEKRVEAARIKEELERENQEKEEQNDALGRKMATPKGKAGRFSDVHMSQFKKMDSIAKHASVTRPTSSSSLRSPEKSLKRTSSKAGLAQEGRDGVKGANAANHTTTKHVGGHMPQPSPQKRLPQINLVATESPKKRVKRAADDDAGTTCPVSSGSDDSAPSTPKRLQMHASNPHLRQVATPTQASLARQNSVKSAQTTKIPGLTRSPSKVSMKEVPVQQPNPPTPLLARSPSKIASLAPVQPKASEQTSDSPLLSRSPVRAPTKYEEHASKDESEQNSSRVPLLSRSPSKMPSTEHKEELHKEPKVPLLSRSPAKATTQESNPFAPPSTPGKTTTTGLMDRLKLLRKSPVKSILRSPQRLYSDDPIKVANGTHLATPERVIAPRSKNFLAPPQTEPIRKHVDFTASTKGSKKDGDGSSTPTKIAAPPPLKDIQTVAQAKLFYPPLPSEHNANHEAATVKKFKRRMTLGANAPGDFTFRVGSGITFGPSPAASKASPKASIRHVSAEPGLQSVAGSRKRKLSFTTALDEVSRMQVENKENEEKDTAATAAADDDEARPAKRVKASTPDAKPITKPVVKSAPTQVARKMPTLGVKPKNAAKPALQNKSKKPGMLSRDRLNMLAMPKRRAGE